MLKETILSPLSQLVLISEILYFSQAFNSLMCMSSWVLYKLCYCCWPNVQKLQLLYIWPAAVAYFVERSTTHLHQTIKCLRKIQNYIISIPALFIYYNCTYWKEHFCFLKLKEWLTYKKFQMVFQKLKYLKNIFE